MNFCYPHHNGHPAWPYYAETVEDAAIEDLFWRKMQVDHTFTKKVIKAVWPDVNESQHELLITPNLSISLLPESYGSYAGLQPCGLNYLYGDQRDIERIEQGTLTPDSGGYYLGPLVAHQRGWLPKNVVHNLMQMAKEDLTASHRFYFSQKANHHRIFFNALEKEEIEAVIGRAYPAIYGFSQYEVFWYTSEDGRITHGIVYFKDPQGNIHKLPLSAWEPTYPTHRRTSVYDMLNISAPYPLYGLDRIVKFSGSRYAVVCSSEIVVNYICKDHGWFSNYFPVTTYSSIEDTNWSAINCPTPIIFPDASKSGCDEAYRLYAALVKLGYKPRFIKRQKDAVVGNFKFDQDFMNGIAFSNNGSSLSEFAEHCLQKFGVQPPDGILPRAVPLANLPEPGVAPEPLMDGLLDTGEQMMIHAWRGVGKSLFAMLLGLCFASGKSALNGRVCPSRKYRVLLLDGEMSAHSLKMRGHRLCSGHDVPQESMEALMVRSVITEKKDLALETDEGFKSCLPDLSWAEVIILDSVFKFFPMSMGAEFAGAGKLLELLHWCREHEKTLIVIDHEGKNRGTSFGTMGKEIALDVVLQLCKAESGRVIKANVKKSRNHEEPSGAYVEMQIDTREEGKLIAFQVRNDAMAKPAREVDSSGIDGGVEVPEHSAAHTPSLEEAILQYVSQNPNVSQGEMAAALVKMGIYGSRSTIQARIKAMSEAGKLPNWQNRPNTHIVAASPASASNEI